jgi:UDP-GlcNAc:undecaprenyl-phosphate/decaprenyl-phosphate GlcNAc-1-phosphate transferase
VNRAALVSIIVAFGLSAALTPLVRNLCIRFGIFDAPGPLKIHQRPIPRLGGVAILSAIIAGCFFGNHFQLGALIPFFGSVAIVWIAGLVDDVRGLAPFVRLFAQTAAALLLWRADFHLLPSANNLWNAIVICALVIFFGNAFNFLDGSDGLAAGIAVMIALASLSAGGTNAAHLKVIAASLLGSAAGFLIYNFPPASAFMGDCGSTTLGVTVAYLALRFPETQAGRPGSLVFPVLVAGLPLFDASLAIVRRLRAGKSPFAGDRSHFYDLTAARGWSARKIALVSYAVTGLLGGIGWIGLRLQARYSLVLAGATFAILFAIALRLGSLRMDAEAPHPAIQAASLREWPQTELDPAISPGDSVEAATELEIAT